MHSIGEKAARRKIDEATQLSMFISIPAAVGLAVLAYPITRLLFPNTNGTAGTLLLIGAVTIIFNTNSNVSNGVLQGIGKANLPMWMRDRIGHQCRAACCASSTDFTWDLCQCWWSTLSIQLSSVF